MKPENHAQMTNPVITCFSDNNENLNLLICELHKYYGSVINQTIFQEEISFLDSLKNSKSTGLEPQLIVIDVNNSRNETIQFIKSINQNSPSAIKLTIAEQNHLDQIQQFIIDKASMHFLNRPWTSCDMNLALNLVSQMNPNLQTSNKDNHKELSFEESVEEKVNERLQKLIDANTAKDSFLSIISHDLKSPFVALLGISEILTDEWENIDNDTKFGLIGDLRKTSEDTYKLLETLLEWSKLQKEKLVVTINEVTMHNLVDSTLKVSENNAALKGIKIQNKINDNIKVFTDERMIATVFRNLISNAIQYTQPGGNINISATEENDFCTFCVSDNGSGIDKAHILDLFKKGSHKKLNGSASAFRGLGLIICKDFVEKNGGQIWLETEKGIGSKFYFTIPC